MSFFVYSQIYPVCSLPNAKFLGDTVREQGRAPCPAKCPLKLSNITNDIPLHGMCSGQPDCGSWPWYTYNLLRVSFSPNKYETLPTVQVQDCVDAISRRYRKGYRKSGGYCRPMIRRFSKAVSHSRETPLSAMVPNNLFDPIGHPLNELLGRPSSKEAGVMASLVSKSKKVSKQRPKCLWTVPL